MLNSLRKGSKSWLAKALLGLLILSFGVWGIGDYVVGGGAYPPVLIVGDQEINADEVRYEFERDLAVLRQNGQNITTEQALAFGLINQTITRLTEGAVLDETGRDLGLTVTDTALARRISNDPMFQSVDGGFDRNRFRTLLATNRLTEAGYETVRRQEEVRSTLIQPLAGAATVPDVVLNRIAEHAGERRSGVMMRISAADLPPPPALPTDDSVLEQVYQDNIGQFTDPEYRSALIVSLSPQGIEAEITVPEEDIRAVYDSRQDLYLVPESRTVTQALFSDQATAQAAADAYRADPGAGLDAAAQAAGGTGAVDMGDIGISDLPEELAQTVFDLAENTLGNPVEGPFGWHLFLVTEAKAEGVAPFADRRDEIETELRIERANDRMFDLSTELDDALAAGTPLDQAARDLALTPVRVAAVSRSGTAPDGSSPLEGVSAADQIVERIFTLTEGEEDLLQETADGFFIARVDGVTPPTPRPLADVRADVISLWQQQQQSDAATALAEKLAAQAEAADDTILANTATTEQGASFQAIPAITRAGVFADLSPAEGDTAPTVPPAEVLTALFDGRPGAVSTVDLPGGDAAVVVLRDIHPADAEELRSLRERLSDQLATSYGTDLVTGWIGSLQNAVGVELNQSGLTAVLDPEFGRGGAHGAM